jgi:hypothetical protein
MLAHAHLFFCIVLHVPYLYTPVARRRTVASAHSWLQGVLVFMRYDFQDSK